MSFAHEIVSSVSADRLFKAALADFHNLGPKIAPEIFISSSSTTGETIGSIRETKFTSVMPFSYVKERLDYIDPENFELKSTVVEGGNLGKTIETASHHFKVEPLGDGGSAVKVVVTYKVIPGAPEADEIPRVKDSLTKQFKGVEAYLLANPTAYA